jgi:hypothetical protein
MPALVFCALLLQQSVSARSLVAVTSWPSFRLGNDLGRFDWYVDLRWSSFAAWGHMGDTTIHDNSFSLEPLAGCNVAVYDSLFTVYVGGGVGTRFEFQNSAYADRMNVLAILGGGIEWSFNSKLSLLGEYMLGATFTFYPDDSYYDYSHGFYNRPSLQLRYYIGPGD